MRGTVKWFSEHKGFGFIYGDDQIERFFHVRDIHGPDLPSNGDLVEFEHEAGRKGPKAAKIKIREKSDSQRNNDKSSRAICSNCGQSIIPRIITGPPLVSGSRWTPVAKHSICPFCGEIHQKFPARTRDIIQYCIFISVILIVLLSIFGTII